MPLLWIRIVSDPHHFAGSGSASRACRTGSDRYQYQACENFFLLNIICCPKFLKTSLTLITSWTGKAVIKSKKKNRIFLNVWNLGKDPHKDRLNFDANPDPNLDRHQIELGSGSASIRCRSTALQNTKDFFVLMKEKYDTLDMRPICVTTGTHCRPSDIVTLRSVLYGSKQSLHVDWLLHQVTFIWAASGQRSTTTSLPRTVSLVFFLIEKLLASRDIQRLPTTPFSLVLRKEYFDCPLRDSFAAHYI